MSSVNAPSGVQTRTIIYEGFAGLDTSRDIRAQDTGKRQVLATLDNGFCDHRGQIVRDPVAKIRAGKKQVTHLRFYGIDKLAWAERDGAGISLTSDADHTLENVYPTNAIVSSTVFNQRAVFAARGLQTYRYDGSLWVPLQSKYLSAIQPAFLATVARRLVAAGFQGFGTRIEISRVDNDDVFSADEAPDSVNVLRAGYIDIANVLGSADQITGITAWEQNRLVVFTSDRALIYRLDPDIDQWTLDERANIQMGCASNNTICPAGTDILFCSRNGVHKIARDTGAGLLTQSTSMSDSIDILYRRLFKSVVDPQEISAVWDQDERQYHVFFPQPGGILSTRLTLNLHPQDETIRTWSTGTHLNARCGAFLAGQLVYGTAQGAWNVGKPEDTDGAAPTLDFTTPVLWHGAIDDTKSTTALVVQATGHGYLNIEAVNEEGTTIASWRQKVAARDDDGAFPDVPFERQYKLQFERRYRGVQFRFRSEGTGLLRIVGFAVTVRK